MVSTPKPPDPYETAQAQGDANREAAIASSIVNNMNEVSPYGNVTYSRSGYESDGAGHNVPRFTRTVELTPDQQTMLDQQNRLGIDLNDLAIGQVNRLEGVLDTPIDLGTTEQARTDAQEALLSRMEPQFDRDRAQLESSLVNRGMVPGSEGYNEAMDELNRRETDARFQAVLHGGAEQAHQAGLKLAERNQPINEVSALMSGGQVTVPQFSAPYQQGIEPAPVADSVWNAYNAEANSAASMNAGLFGLAAAPFGMFSISDRRMKENVVPVGRTPKGLPLYQYNLKGSDVQEVGVMADEAELVFPDAVREFNGVKMVDYSRIG